MAKIIPLDPGKRLATQQARQKQKAAKPERDRQIGVDPDLGEIISKYSGMTGISMRDLATEAFEAWGIREKYAKLLEQEAARARSSRRHER